VGGIAAADVAARRERLVALAQAFAALTATATTQAKVTRAVTAHGLEWMTLACRTAVFISEDAAREAVLCVRDEGRDFAEVAAAAGVDVDEARLVIEDLDPETQITLRSAEEGTLVGPLSFQGGLTLVWVARKSVPDAHDPAQRARASAWLLDAAITRHAGRARFLLEL
jgi:hypothetical protein